MVDERATRAVCGTSSTVSHKPAVIDSAYGRASMFAHVALFLVDSPPPLRALDDDRTGPHGGIGQNGRLPQQ
jgi:hypothetical protein